MTGNTIGGEIRLLMIGVGGTIVFGGMAIVTDLRKSGVLPIFMAIGTYGGLMFPIQREFGMIDNGPGPGGGRRAMATLALGGIGRLLMIGVGGASIVQLVATVT